MRELLPAAIINPLIEFRRQQREDFPGVHTVQVVGQIQLLKDGNETVPSSRSVFFSGRALAGLSHPCIEVHSVGGFHDRFIADKGLSRGKLMGKFTLEMKGGPQKKPAQILPQTVNRVDEIGAGEQMPMAIGITRFQYVAIIFSGFAKPFFP